MGDSGRGGSPKSGKSAACLSRKREKPKERPPRLQFRNLLCRISNRVLPATIRLKRRPRQVRSGQDAKKNHRARGGMSGAFLLVLISSTAGNRSKSCFVRPVGHPRQH